MTNTVEVKTVQRVYSELSITGGPRVYNENTVARTHSAVAAMVFVGWLLGVQTLYSKCQGRTR